MLLEAVSLTFFDFVDGLGSDCKDTSPEWKCNFFLKNGKCDKKGEECKKTCGICTTETGNILKLTNPTKEINIVGL